MEQGSPNKQILLVSRIPKGSEDVAFKKSPNGPTVVKAHAIVLANESIVFADQIYPLSEGQSYPIVISDWWTEAKRSHDEAHERALKVFVKMLYGTEPETADLDKEVLLGLHNLAQYYQISGLANDVIERIKCAQIPLSEIPAYISFVWGRGGIWPDCRNWCSKEQAEAFNSSIEQTIKNIPGTRQIFEAAYDLDPLKGQLLRNLPGGTDLDRLLDAYRKFLALKV